MPNRSLQISNGTSNHKGAFHDGRDYDAPSNIKGETRDTVKRVRRGEELTEKTKLWEDLRELNIPVRENQGACT